MCKEIQDTGLNKLMQMQHEPSDTHETNGHLRVRPIPCVMSTITTIPVPPSVGATPGDSFRYTSAASRYHGYVHCYGICREGVLYPLLAPAHQRASPPGDHLPPTFWTVKQRSYLKTQLVGFSSEASKAMTTSVSARSRSTFKLIPGDGTSIPLPFAFHPKV